MSLAELDDTSAAPATEGPVLEMDSIDKEFVLGGAFLNQTFLKALSGVSLQLTRGKALALVGESGSGKSTCARMLAGAYEPSAGSIRYRGEDIARFDGKRMQIYRAQVQMVFQDPFGSLNPTQSIGYHLERPIRLHRPDLKGKAIEAEMLDLLERVGLRPAADYLKRRPHELSGGQRQRVAIARALSVQPEVLLADEPTSMLDVSVRLGILNLLEDLKRDRQLAALYITHDIATARYFAEETAVMYAGHLVEQGPKPADHRQPAPPLYPIADRIRAQSQAQDRDGTGTSGRRHSALDSRQPRLPLCLALSSGECNLQGDDARPYDARGGTYGQVSQSLISAIGAKRTSARAA